MARSFGVNKIWAGITSAGDKALIYIIMIIIIIIIIIIITITITILIHHP